MKKGSLSRPLLLLLACWIVVSTAWLIAQRDFSYQNTSDIGFHLYNLKHFYSTGFSFYNGEWYWGAEYLTIYSPGTYMVGGLFSWMLPGMAGAILSFKLIVIGGLLAGLFGVYALVRRMVDERTALVAALLYSLSPFVWSTLNHSLPDFLAYMLLPGMLAAWHRSVETPARRNVAFATLLFSLHVLTSIIVAFHAAVAAALLIALSMRRQWSGALLWRYLRTGVFALLLCTVWMLPFFGVLTAPDYGTGKVSLEGAHFVRAYAQSIIGSLHPSVLLHDAASIFNPLARHPFPFVFALLAVPMLFIRSPLRTPFGIVALLGVALGVFSFAANSAAFSMALLQEKARWFDIANLALTILSAGTFTLLWNKVKRQRWRIAVGSLATIIGLLFVASLLTQHTNAAVDETIAREQPTATLLQQDNETLRVAEFPYHYMPYSSYVHGKDLLFGGCEYCNRYPKIATVVAYEPYTAHKPADAPPAVAYTAQYFGALNTKYVVLYDTKEFPQLGMNSTYAYDELIDAPGFSLADKASSQEQGAYWKLVPKDVTFEENSVHGPLRWYLRPAQVVLCANSSYAAGSCQDGTFTMELRGILATTVNGSLIVPYGTSPALDRLLRYRWLFNPFNPLFHVEKHATPVVVHTTVLENLLVRDRVESVQRVQHIPAQGSMEAFDWFWEQSFGGAIDPGVAYSHTLSDNSYAEARIEIEEHTNTRYRFTVEAPGESLIVVREGHSPYWRASIDGRQEDIHFLQPGIMGLVVPAGTHTVELRYRNTLMIAGAVISVLALAALAGYAFFRRPIQL